MSDKTFDTIREKIEYEYQQLRQALDDWRDKRIEALNLLSKPITKNFFDFIHFSPDSNQPDQNIGKTHRSRTRDGKVNQQFYIKSAIMTLSKDISKPTILRWIREKYPDVVDKINVKSIQTGIWRAVQKGVLQEIGRDGNIKIYARATAQLPKLQGAGSASYDEPTGEGGESNDAA